MSTAAPSSVPWHWRLLRRYCRAELPMWGRLYALCGGTDEARWRTAGSAELRGKVHGYRFDVDLGNWSDRLVWCLARYHDLPLELAVRALVRAGDTFVDVGANRGHVSLLACHLVGPQGRVVACEPNPHLHARLQRLANDNGLQQLRACREALGSVPGNAELHEFAGHSGWGSLVPESPQGTPATATFPVAVARGDDLLPDLLGPGPLVCKIDVEGFEVEVLRGMPDVLGTKQPIVFLELVDEHQRRAGHSADELASLLTGRGYRGYALGRRRGLFGSRLELAPLDTCPWPFADTVFVPPAAWAAARVAALLPH